MAKRNEHDDEDVDDESNSQLKKQRMDELAVATLPGSMELTSSGAVRNVAPQSILQSSTVLLTGHTEAIYSIAFDPTGMHLASASLDRSISEDLDASLSTNVHILFRKNLCLTLKLQLHLISVLAIFCSVLAKCFGTSRESQRTTICLQDIRMQYWK